MKIQKLFCSKYIGGKIKIKNHLTKTITIQ